MPLLGEMTGKNKIIGVAAAVLIIVSLIVIIRNFGTHTPQQRIPKKAYFTVDDGATLFADDWDKVAPFKHDDKDAVRAHVFSNDGGATKKVLSLEKYKAEDVAKKEAMKQGDPSVTDEPSPLYKKPGDRGWVDFTRKQYSDLQNPASLGEYQGWVEVYPD